MSPKSQGQTCMQSFTTMQTLKHSQFSVRGSPYQPTSYVESQRRRLHSMVVPTTEHDVSMITVEGNQDMLHAIAWPGRDSPKRCQIKPEEQQVLRLDLVAEEVLVAEQVLVALAPAEHLHWGLTQRPGGAANPRRHHAATQQHGSHRLDSHQSRQPAHQGLKP